MAFIPVPLWNILSTYLSDALARFTILCIHVCLHAFLRHYCAKFPEEGAVEEQPSSQLLSYYPCSPHLLNVLAKALPFATMFYFMLHFSITWHNTILLITMLNRPLKVEIFPFCLYSYPSPRRVRVWSRYSNNMQERVTHPQHQAPGTHSAAAPSARFRHPEQNQWPAFLFQCKQKHITPVSGHSISEFVLTRARQQDQRELLQYREEKAMGQRRDISSTYCA